MFVGNTPYTNKAGKIKDYTIADKKDRITESKASGEVAIYRNNTTNAKNLTIFTKIEAIAVNICTRTSNIMQY